MLPVLIQALVLASAGLLSVGSITLVILLLISDRGWYNGLGYALGYTGAYTVIAGCWMEEQAALAHEPCPNGDPQASGQPRHVASVPHDDAVLVGQPALRLGGPIREEQHEVRVRWQDAETAVNQALLQPPPPPLQQLPPLNVTLSDPCAVFNVYDSSAPNYTRIVYGEPIAFNLGGTIQAENNDGPGCTITLLLPL